MAAAAIGAVVSVGASLVGAGMQADAMKTQNKAMQKAEKLRQQQMNLQAARERRDAIRKAMLARATALATATSQGAAAAGSSALGGAYGSIEGEKNRQSLAINQNQQIGQGIFKQNQIYSEASLQAGFGEAIAGAGQAIGNFVSKGANSGWKFTS